MKSRQKGKKKGGPKERVFGCDLQEHLQHSGQEVPQVLRSCAEFVEEYGVVDGIYRLSGVSSNIQRLRQEFEAERKPDLRRDVYLQDIHCVSSLCKAYFRELPDPLLTYRLYDKFAEAVAVQLEPERLVKILEVLRELPVPNYRTLEFLMRHLVHMASFSAQTNMHARNLAIVWAPNLLRSKDIEASGFNGTAAFMEVRVQSIVVEFILTHVDRLFGGTALSGGDLESGGWRSLPGLRASGGPEDLMPRSLPYHLPSVLQAGDGPPQIRPYHTIIEIAEHKRKGSLKVRKWRSIFNLGRSGHETKRKLPRGAEDREDRSDKGTLRPAKSMDSLSASAGASDEPEGLLAPSSPQPSPLMPERLENDSAEGAEGEVEPEAEALGSTNSEPGTPRAGRPAARAGGGSRAERCAGVHISDPYNVNLPLHITSILNVPPNIISNVSLARLTRGLECPALQPRGSPVSGPGPGPSPPDEKLEASPAPGALADSGPAALAPAPALEDCLSQEVQDSFSFLEDSSGSEPEWVGVEAGDVAKAGAAGAAFSPGDDDPGIGYLEELLGAGPQVEEFSVEPPLDELSLDDAQFVLAPSCCSLDSAGPGPAAEEENGEEVFLSAYDDLSPLLGPEPQAWESLGSLEEETTGCGRQAEEGQPCWEVGEDKEAEAGSRWDIREEAEGSPEGKVEAGEAGEEGGDAGGSQEMKVSLEEGCEEETQAKDEETKGPQEDEHMEEAKGVEETEGEQGKEEEERMTERQEEAEEGEEAGVEAGRDPQQRTREKRAAEESWEVLHTQEAEGEVPGQGENRVEEARGDQGDGEDRSAEAAAGGGAGEVSKERESGDGEAEGEQGAGGDRLEGGFLLEGSCVVSLEVDSAKEGNAQSSETERAAPQPPRPEEMEPEGQPSAEGCSPCPCPLSSAGSVGMRLASTLVQVQQVRSVPVVPPKPQFAKMPGAMCSKIHVGPANPCPRPGRLDGTPGERGWGSRASRSSWRNGGSLSFDAAVARARDRQRTEAQGVRRTQTCTGGEDYSLLPRTSPCSGVPAHSPRPLSFLELPPEGAERSEPRSRFSLPPREPQALHPLVPPQRRTYAFETQANPGKGEGL
ncbi:rho GTPase-activating protein 30 isoform X2 [Desmodus rotundus]|uniref:rho GTPase-activating protein 30 isoform X2 n=1 Tax=Desmodus rotundus TaxID=9430 RepID=UPI0023815927|nr:rho GTPase-activating protein 30 isoform X2 [Desmodus rotundus]